MHNDTPDPTLASPFDSLRCEMARLNAPPGVEQELMAAFAQQFPPQPRWYRKLLSVRWPLPAVAVAAAALAALVLAVLPGAPDHPADHGFDTPLIGRDSGIAFIALESFERIEREPSPRLVETEVPRTALASLGLPITPENAGDSVRAQMLVGADGQPLALRLLQTNHQPQPERG